MAVLLRADTERGKTFFTEVNVVNHESIPPRVIFPIYDRYCSSAEMAFVESGTNIGSPFSTVIFPGYA